MWEPQDGDQNDVPHLEAFHKQIICTSPFPIFINFMIKQVAFNNKIWRIRMLGGEKNQIISQYVNDTLLTKVRKGNVNEWWSFSRIFCKFNSLIGRRAWHIGMRSCALDHNDYRSLNGNRQEKKTFEMMKYYLWAKLISFFLKRKLKYFKKFIFQLLVHSHHEFNASPHTLLI